MDEKLTERFEYDFSKAQLKRFNDLQMAVKRAQAELQSFADYLAEEHGLSDVELPAGYEWQIGPKGFRGAPGQANNIGDPGADHVGPDGPIGMPQQMAPVMQNGAR